MGLGKKRPSRGSGVSRDPNLPNGGGSLMPSAKRLNTGTNRNGQRDSVRAGGEGGHGNGMGLNKINK